MTPSLPTLQRLRAEDGAEIHGSGAPRSTQSFGAFGKETSTRSIGEDLGPTVLTSKSVVSSTTSEKVVEFMYAVNYLTVRFEKRRYR
jgi:hypothetical protein